MSNKKANIGMATVNLVQRMKLTEAEVISSKNKRDINRGGM
jgi:hypothetical protein